MEPYIPLSRSFFAGPLWNKERVYSQAEAWIDMLYLARFEPTIGRVWVEYRVVEVDKGEFCASLRFLAKRWSWSKSHVARFLDLLCRVGLITVRPAVEQQQTLIKLADYDACTRIFAGKTADGRTTPSSVGGFPKNGTAMKKNCNENAQKTGQQTECDKSDYSDTRDTTGTRPGHDRDTTGTKNYYINSNNKKKVFLTKDQKRKPAGTAGLGARHSEEDCDGISSAPTPVAPAPEFERFRKWIHDNAPAVARMESPFTRAEYERLRDEYGIDYMKRIILEMHNYKPLLQKNRSANLTFRNWVARRRAAGDDDGRRLAPKSPSEMRALLDKFKNN